MPKYRVDEVTPQNHTQLSDLINTVGGCLDSAHRADDTMYFIVEIPQRGMEKFRVHGANMGFVISR